MRIIITKKGVEDQTRGEIRMKPDVVFRDLKAECHSDGNGENRMIPYSQASTRNPYHVQGKLIRSVQDGSGEIHPSDFLRQVWAADQDEQKLADWVKAQSAEAIE